MCRQQLARGRVEVNGVGVDDHTDSTNLVRYLEALPRA